jgi:hypothetical protein
VTTPNGLELTDGFNRKKLAVRPVQQRAWKGAPNTESVWSMATKT